MVQPQGACRLLTSSLSTTTEAATCMNKQRIISTTTLLLGLVQSGSWIPVLPGASLLWLSRLVVLDDDVMCVDSPATPKGVRVLFFARLRGRTKFGGGAFFYQSAVVKSGT